MPIYPIGTEIGQYRVLSAPMLGGMGVVYACHDLENDRAVALKTFKPEYLPDRAARDRFLREGTAWVELGTHPHIVRCHEVIYLEPVVFLVLELIEPEQGLVNASLRSWLNPAQPLETGQALLFTLQIASGLQHACRKIPGFVHRDLKPENVLVGADKLPGTQIHRLRVTDFGLIHVLENFGNLAGAGQEPVPGGSLASPYNNRDQLTRGLAGTPLYMAPEQWRGNSVGIFTDVYALGCILGEMLTGHPLAQGRTLDELRNSHCSGSLHPLPQVPDVVTAFLKQCLDLTPDKRFKSWETVIAMLEAAYQTCSGQTAPKPYQHSDSESTDQTRTGASYIALGSSYLHMGKPQVAIDYFEQALGLARVNRNVGEMAAALGNLGQANYQLGETRTAIEYFEQCLELQRENHNLHAESHALSDLGMAYLDLDKPEMALQSLSLALQIARKIGDLSLEGNLLGNLGITSQHLDDSRQAIDYQQQALAIHRATGHRRSEEESLGNLASAYLHADLAEEALPYCLEAIDIAREIGDRRGEANSLGNLGLIWKKLGDVEKAVEYLELCLNVHQEIGDQRGQMTAIESLGRIFSDQRRNRDAITCFEKALALARDLDEPILAGNFLRQIGDAWADLGQAKQAVTYYEQTIEIYRATHNRSGEAEVLGSLALSNHQWGDTRRAVGYYEQYIKLSHELGNEFAEGAGLANLGLIYFNEGDSPRALACFEQALPIRKKIGDVNGVGTDLYNMAMLYGRQGDIEYAVSLAQEAIRIFSSIPDAQKVNQTHDLIAKLRGNEPDDANEIIQAAFEAFQRASSMDEMRLAVTKYTFMIKMEFIQLIEQVVNEQVLPEHRPGFEQRLTMLRQIAAGK